MYAQSTKCDGRLPHQKAAVDVRLYYEKKRERAKEI